jgi:hypothetical protein
MRQAAANSALRYGSVEPKESNGVNGYGSYKEEQVRGGGGMHQSPAAPHFRLAGANPASTCACCSTTAAGRRLREWT